MRIIMPYWSIGYRQNCEEEWKLVKNPKHGWAADPFLFPFNNDIFLFGEIWSYRLGRGYIGCSKFEGDSFGKWREAICEPWHLSYPNIFLWNHSIYMVPEQYQSGEIALYECVEFPYHWRRLRPLAVDGLYVDSTVLFLNDAAWIFTLKIDNNNHSNGVFMRAKFISPEQIGEWETIVPAGGKKHRPGGNFLFKDGKVYRVAQNCEEFYGRGLIFYEVIRCNDREYKEEEKKKLFTSDYIVNGNITNNYIGVHTYNKYDDFEVIDLKKKVFSIDESFYRIKNKLLTIR